MSGWYGQVWKTAHQQRNLLSSPEMLKIFSQLLPYQFNSLYWTQWNLHSIMHTFSAASIQMILSFMKTESLSFAEIFYDLCRHHGYRWFDSQRYGILVRVVVLCQSRQLVRSWDQDWRTRYRHANGIDRSPDLGSHVPWCWRHLWKMIKMNGISLLWSYYIAELNIVWDLLHYVHVGNLM